MRRQEQARTCHAPRYFYVDETKTCVQCGEWFTFGAAEQKYWYESLQFPFDSVAIRCVDCRRQRRTAHALRTQIASARERSRDVPDDPAPWLDLAEALVRYHERTGEGRLDDAIAAARRARELWPAAAEAWFWEGLAQAQSGRKAKARDAFKQFLRESAETKKTRAMRDVALAWLSD